MAHSITAASLIPCNAAESSRRSSGSKAADLDQPPLMKMGFSRPAQLVAHGTFDYSRLVNPLQRRGKLPAKFGIESRGSRSTALDEDGLFPPRTTGGTWHIRLQPPR